MHHPSHQWCPKCSALLPNHLDECPRCQTKLKGGSSSGFTGKDILHISAVMISVGIIPMLVVIAIAFICINSLQ